MPRPRIPLISRDSTVETALRVIEADGYRNFSVEKVARAMGVISPSLYHHFVNRTGLLNEVARALLEGAPMEADPPRSRLAGMVRVVLGEHLRPDHATPLRVSDL